MIVLRLVFGLLLLASVLCFGASIYTGDVRWRRLGLTLLKWTLGAALVFFAVLFVERLLTL